MNENTLANWESLPQDEVLESILANRYSCRGFLPQALSPSRIERILTLAQLTPSWCNSQPWQVVLVSGQALAELSEEMLRLFGRETSSPDISFPKQYVGVYQDRRRECGVQLYEAVGIVRGDREASHLQTRRNFSFFGAPHLAVITAPQDLGVYGAIDCGAYVSTFMYVARSLGIAAIAQAAIANFSPLLHQKLNIPSERNVVCGISFGLEDANDPANQFRTRRASLDEVVSWRY